MHWSQACQRQVQERPFQSLVNYFHSYCDVICIDFGIRSGGAGTAISSYIARSRGTNEPQASEQRATDLQKFLRDINAFIGDHGDKDGLEHNSQITTFRERFNDILGNEMYQ